MKREDRLIPFLTFRHYSVLLLLLCSLAALIGRGFYLQIVEKDFLAREGVQRQIRVIETPAYRGTIFDRLGTPLAISTPVDSVWVNPSEMLKNLPALKAVAAKLGLDYPATVKKLKQKHRAGKVFFYLQRHLEPEVAQAIANKVEGVYLQREYRRYYPAGEVVSHLVGFTNIDDQGQEGLELVYDRWLRAEPGQRRVIRSRKGAVVENIAQIKRARAGQDIYSSIDMRLQYIAYRSLKRAIAYHGAKSGSAVLLDVRTGEVLAMVNQPSYNPNQRSQVRVAERRNRALTDVFEPGSAIKPFTLAAAIDQGLYHTESLVDTSPGWLMVKGHPVKDIRNYGKLSLADILRQSSNVGASRIALSMQGQALWNSFSSYGFGQPTGAAFPAESSGYFRHYTEWQPLDHATIGFGYGLSLSITQLARAYGMIANKGREFSISLLKNQPAENHDRQIDRRVLKPSTANMMLSMMEHVVSPDGTAAEASVTGYRIAGKTGTAKKSINGGYQNDDYIAVFAGIAPVSAPRLVMAVMIDEPVQNGYYGGVVSAPVFRQVMENALRILDIAPDDLSILEARSPHPEKNT